MDRQAEIDPLAGAERYRARRERVFAPLGEDSALVLAGNAEIIVGRDTELRYVVDPEVYYLTGYTEPDGVIVLCPSHQEAPFTMFVRPRDPGLELWSGSRGGVEAATERFGANAAFPIAELSQRLGAIVGGVDTLYARLDSGRAQVDDVVRGTITAARRSRPRTAKGPLTLTDPGVLLDELRVVKDEHELSLMRTAARISAEGFLDAIARVQPGRGEWEIEAALEAGFRSRGADGFAFPSIVAAGANATVLHYVTNDCVLRDGQLLLIDAGARYRRYASDITRTVPVNGRFSPEQLRLYDVVLRAQQAALAEARPGATVDGLHNAALRVLIDGMIAEQLLEGRADEIIASEDQYKRYYPHRTSHWLGLEVHDVGAYAFREGTRPLEAGMVLTIEPGLYIAESAEVPAALRGTGIRIEDSVLITERGCEVLTAAVPTSPDALERLMTQARSL